MGGKRRPRSARQQAAQRAACAKAQKVASERREAAVEAEALPQQAGSTRLAEGAANVALAARVAKLALHTATPDRWRPTAVKRVASLPAGVEAELRKEIAELWRMARGAVIRVVHCLKDPHLPFGWQHGGRGGLGAVPIGDAKAWAVQEAGAIDMHAERAKRAARVQALEAGTPKRSPLLTAVGNAAYKAEAARWRGCFEWLRARHMELHFDVRHGPVVLSKGEAPWTNETRGLQIMAVPDFRELLPPDHEFRVALRGLEHAFGSWEALRAHRLNSEFTVQQAMDAYSTPTSHSAGSHHFHDWTACHALSIAGLPFWSSAACRTDLATSTRQQWHQLHGVADGTAPGTIGCYLLPGLKLASLFPCTTAAFVSIATALRFDPMPARVSWSLGWGTQCSREISSEDAARWTAWAESARASWAQHGTLARQCS